MELIAAIAIFALVIAGMSVGSIYYEQTNRWKLRWPEQPRRRR